MAVHNSEIIKFQIKFAPVYWDQPPVANILLDGKSQFSGPITQDSKQVAFTAMLEFGQEHELAIHRSGKTGDQCVIDNGQVIKDQMLPIESIVIDGVNIQNFIWALAWFEPEYPEPWATQQRDAGVALEEKLFGESFLGHNGTWRFKFTAPFYDFVMTTMIGED
jgi:hypothetical protein